MLALLSSTLGLAFPFAALAGTVGTITMIEGAAQLIRGANVYATAPGLALETGDVVTTAGPAFVQLEFINGTIIALGPDSSVYLADYRESRKGRTTSAQYTLLHGWFKAESATASDATGEQFWCRSISVAKHSGSVVFQVTGTAQQFFVETGTVTVTPVESSRPPTAVGPGQFVSRLGEAPLSLAAGVPASFVGDMPRAFRDTLPPAPFQDAVANARALREVTYDDVAEMLTLPDRWRSGFVHRFGGRLKDPAFRRAVEAHLTQHPEWDRVLRPGKHRPVDSRRPPAKSPRKRSSP
jgi:hypothetical protein